MTLAQLKAQYKTAKKEYYNGASSMSDAEFDRLEDRIKKLEPSWEELGKTGVKVANKKTEVDLLEPMPSLNKMYPEAVEKFYKKYKAVKTWTWMDKLDGTSLQLVYQNGKPARLITRGDGTRGGDISFFIPHLVKLKRIPASISSKEQTILRLEGLMPKTVFAKHWAAKFDNIRNTVNGLFNRKDMHDALKHVDLVVLGVYNYTLPEGLKLARKWGFEVVYHRITADSVEHTEALASRRLSSQYEMDGLVIAPADWVMDYEDSEKPTQLVAFKFNDESNAAQVKVKRIIYQTSGFGRIIPKVEIEPTKMDGVMVKHCTVHNAKWMLDRKIGPGAVIKMVRSGGVIPKVVGVVRAGKIQLPEVEHELRGVHFHSLEDSKEQDIRVIDRFLGTLGIEFIARKTIAHLYDFGLTSPATYIKLAAASPKVIKHMLDPAELGPKQSAKIVGELQRVLCAEIPLKTLMVASPCFDVGVGDRRLSAIEAAGISMDKLMLSSSLEVREMLEAIKGFGKTTAKLIDDGLEEFHPWFSSVIKYITVNGKLPKAKKVVAKAGAKLAGVKVTFTGYRDKSAESFIEGLGGEVVAFSAKTTVLIYKEGGKSSSKVEKAGDKAMTWGQFVTKYGVK